MNRSPHSARATGPHNGLERSRPRGQMPLWPWKVSKGGLKDCQGSVAASCLAEDSSRGTLEQFQGGMEHASSPT